MNTQVGIFIVIGFGVFFLLFAAGLAVVAFKKPSKKTDEKKASKKKPIKLETTYEEENKPDVEDSEQKSQKNKKTKKETKEKKNSTGFFKKKNKKSNDLSSFADVQEKDFISARPKPKTTKISAQGGIMDQIHEEKLKEEAAENSGIMFQDDRLYDNEEDDDFLDHLKSFTVDYKNEDGKHPDEEIDLNKQIHEEAYEMFLTKEGENSSNNSDGTGMFGSRITSEVETLAPIGRPNKQEVEEETAEKDDTEGLPLVNSKQEEEYSDDDRTHSLAIPTKYSSVITKYEEALKRSRQKRQEQS